VILNTIAADECPEPAILASQRMFYLLVILSLLSMGTGVFIVGFGVPIRETAFGAGLLVAGTVAITGGFLLVGLAAAIAELQLMVKALRARVPGPPRNLRPAERKDAPEKRPGPPRLPFPPRRSAEAPATPREPDNETPAAPSHPAPAAAEPMPRQLRPEWLRRAMAEIESPPAPVTTESDEWPRLSEEPPPGVPEASPADHGGGETRPALGPAPPPIQPNRFDAIWPDRRRGSETGDKRAEADMPPPPHAQDTRLPPIEPPSAAAPLSAPPSEDARVESRPSVLKTGVIDEMSYTLFTDGSIEAQMPDGTMRFGSVEELRRHLDQHGE
jgi:hypothetical protein